VSAGHVADLAQQISNMSGIDDEAVHAGENMLLTFTNIRNEVGKGNDIFDQATLAAANMSTAMGTDITRSSLQLGKALQDPVRGMTALRKAGVAVTKDQQAQVAAMVASGNTMGAQKLILAELNREFGGSAKAAGETLPGQMAKARNAFEGVAAAVLQRVIPAILLVVQTVRSSFEPIVGVIRQYSTAIIAAGAATGVMVTVIGGLRILAAVRTAWVAVNLAMAANPAIRIALIIGVVVAALVTLYRESETARRVMNTAFNGIKAVVVPILNVVKTAISGFLAILRGDWSAAWNALKSVVSSALSGALAVIRGYIGLHLAAGKAIGTAIWNGVKAGVQKLVQIGAEVVTKIGSSLASVAGAILEFGLNIGRKIVEGIIQAVRAAAGAIAGAVRDAVSGALSSAAGAVASGVKGIIGKIPHDRGGFSPNVQVAFAGLKPGPGSANLIGALRAQESQAAGELNSSRAGLSGIPGLRSSAAALSPEIRRLQAQFNAAPHKTAAEKAARHKIEERFNFLVEKRKRFLEAIEGREQNAIAAANRLQSIREQIAGIEQANADAVLAAQEKAAQAAAEAAEAAAQAAAEAAEAAAQAAAEAEDNRRAGFDAMIALAALTADTADDLVAAKAKEAELAAELQAAQEAGNNALIAQLAGALLGVRNDIAQQTAKPASQGGQGQPFNELTLNIYPTGAAATDSRALAAAISREFRVATA
jgi:hypothetical protein